MKEEKLKLASIAQMIERENGEFVLIVKDKYTLRFSKAPNVDAIFEIDDINFTVDNMYFGIINEDNEYTFNDEFAEELFDLNTPFDEEPLDLIANVLDYELCVIIDKTIFYICKDFDYNMTIDEAQAKLKNYISLRENYSDDTN